MRFLLLVCAGSDFDPPPTMDADTDAWVARADADYGRTAGDVLRPPSEAVVVGPDGVTVGARVSDDEQVVGFDLLECADLDAATEIVRAHPMARAGRIEIRALLG